MLLLQAIFLLHHPPLSLHLYSISLGPRSWVLRAFLLLHFPSAWNVLVSELPRLPPTYLLDFSLNVTSSVLAHCPFAVILRAHITVHLFICSQLSEPASHQHVSSVGPQASLCCFFPPSLYIKTQNSTADINRYQYKPNTYF